MRRRLVPAILAISLATAVAGCGGSTSSKGSASSGASGADIVPASAPVFVSVNTDTSSDQWKKLDDLSQKFPDRDKALTSIQSSMEKDGVNWDTDVKPALGKEVDIAFLDVRDGGNDVVVITKPKDESKLNAALAKGTSAPVHDKIDGWTVYANTQSVLDRFKAASDKEKHLSDSDNFKSATADQPDEAAAKFYVRGTSLSQALAQSSAGSSSPISPSSLSGLGGQVDWIAGAVVAAGDGLKLEVSEKGNQSFSTYKPTLPDDLPANALLVVSFGDLSTSLKKALDSALSANPSYQAQLKQVEQGLGFSIENDVLPLLSKEGAVAVYEGDTAGAPPTVVALLKVDDEQKATSLLDRLGALAALGGGATTGATPVTIDGVPAKKLTLGTQTIYYAGFDGKLVISNAESGIAGVHASGNKLSGDSQYKEARDSAGASGDTTGFLYANLEKGLPLLFTAAATTRGVTATEEQARADLAPLRSVYVGSTKDGDKVKLNGFVTIK